jgi:hypothetical protein
MACNDIGDVFLCLEKMFFVVTQQATSEEQPLVV